MQGSVLVLLLVVASFTEAHQPSHQECTDESAVNMSHLIGLRYYRSRKMESIPTMELMNNTLEDVEEIDASINNMITPELQDLDYLETCDTKVPIDCCQVKL